MLHTRSPSFRPTCWITTRLLLQPHAVLTWKDKLAELLTVYGRTLDNYIVKFEWDTQKYNVGGLVRDVAGEIGQVCTCARGLLISSVLLLLRQR